MYEVIRSYGRNFNGKERELKKLLNEGYKVLLVTPFTENGDVKYLEYILEEPNLKDDVLEIKELINRTYSKEEIDQLIKNTARTVEREIQSNYRDNKSGYNDSILLKHSLEIMGMSKTDLIDRVRRIELAELGDIED